MQIPLQITARGLTLTDADRELISEQVAKLEELYGALVRCHVTVTIPNKRLHGDPVQHTVHVKLTMPQGELVVKRQPQLELPTAIQDAFQAAGRQLQDYSRKQRGLVKEHASPPHAIVSKLFTWDGYGFLETPDGREIYFHRNSVLDGGFDKLAPGAEVRFVEQEGERGPQASSVSLLRRQHA